MTTRKLGVVMDPIANINPKKDSSLAMMLAAQERGWQIHVTTLPEMFVADGIAKAQLTHVQVRDDLKSWFTSVQTFDAPLASLDAIFMRKDPPFDNEYLYATHLLELAETQGSLVVNKPAGLRDYNEKLAIARFPQCTTEFLVSRDLDRLKAFIRDTKDTVLKPLDAMGGKGIFRISQDDKNTNSILETLTDDGRNQVMIQRYIPEITAGDKRILLVNGKPFPYALARIPTQGEFRGNLAAGGRSEGIALSKRDYWICEQLAEQLVSDGHLFVGLDVIGDYLTEINVTSPTCIRELDALYEADIAGQLVDEIEALL